MPRKNLTDEFICTPEARYCDRPGVEQPPHFSLELAETLGACGITCTGKYAEQAKAAGRCGLPDATEDVVATQLIEEGVRNMTSPPGTIQYGPGGVRRIERSVPVSAFCDAGEQAARRMFERGEDPIEAINTETRRFGVTVGPRPTA